MDAPQAEQLSDVRTVHPVPINAGWPGAVRREDATLRNGEEMHTRAAAGPAA